MILFCLFVYMHIMTKFNYLYSEHVQQKGALNLLFQIVIFFFWVHIPDWMLRINLHENWI